MKKTENIVRTPELVERALELQEDQSDISLRSFARELDVSYGTAHRLRHQDLELSVYKIQTSQAMSNQDFTKRLDFGKFMLEQIQSGAIDPGRIIFTGEAHFHLDGYVNKQNYRIWGTEKPSIRTKPLHPQRGTVWRGICEERLLVPIFIEAGKTVDREVYAEILQTAIEETRSKGMIGGLYWQQDGATPHRASENLRTLHETFGRRVIAKGFPSKFNAGCE